MSAAVSIDPRRGPQMLTYSGKLVHVLDMRDEDIDIGDIAHALANTNRYYGHLGVCSTAQHSVWVSEKCNPDDAREGLLHDGAESFAGDVSSPTKQAMRIIASAAGRTSSDYDAIEALVEVAVARRFGLRHPWPESVKCADLAAIHHERSEAFVPWPPAFAKAMFLRRFYDLFGKDFR